MTERMKDHLRQPCVLTELCKLFVDDPILAGPSIWKCHHQIEVLIFVAQEAFQLVLGLLPFPQDVSQCFWQPHLTDTGIGFRLFQNLSFACSLRMGEILGLTWENVHISDEDIAADNAYVYIDKELTRASKRAIETLGEKDIYYIFTPFSGGSHCQRDFLQ